MYHHMLASWLPFINSFDLASFFFFFLIFLLHLTDFLLSTNYYFSIYLFVYLLVIYVSPDRFLLLTLRINCFNSPVYVQCLTQYLMLNNYVEWIYIYIYMNEDYLILINFNEKKGTLLSMFEIAALL